MLSPVFSLIVPTINRTKELSILLESLCHQEFKDFEVIIVDQNHEDILNGIITSFKDDLVLTHLRVSARGASGARNTGLGFAKGEIITFPDDDCVYPSNLLRVVNEIFFNKSISGLCISSYDPESKGKVARLAKASTAVHTYNILKTVIEAGIFVRAKELGNLHFDEDLGVGARTGWGSDEGPDLVLRLIKKGCSFSYRPDIVIYHPDPVKKFDDKAISRSYKYGCGRGRFLRKHNYPLWFAIYIYALYLVGMIIGILQFNFPKIKYYYSGLKGRVLGFYGKV